MARLDASGTDEMMRMLRGIGSQTQEIIKRAVFDGAGALADAVAQAVTDLPAEPFHPLPGARNGMEPLNVLTEDDREDLLNGIGIARFGLTGDGVDTAVSFDGYSRHKSKEFPNGVPLPVIARSIESGSSARQKHPFVRPAVNGAKAHILQVMEDKVRSCIDSLQTTGTLPPYSASTAAAHGGKGFTKTKD